MYAFLDLRTRQFLQKEPDEPVNSERQRAALERQLVRMAKSHPEAILVAVHMDDTSDETDWTSDTIIGPKGGRCAIQLPDASTDDAVDLPKAIKEVLDTFPVQLQLLQNEAKAKLAELHRTITTQSAALQSEYERRLSALYKQLSADVMAAAKPGKKRGGVTVPTYSASGYDMDGKWHEAGEIVKEKKKKAS